MIQEITYNSPNTYIPCNKCVEVSKETVDKLGGLNKAVWMCTVTTHVCFLHLVVNTPRPNVPK